MAFVLSDRIKETTTTTGTGAVTLGGAVTGFEAFSARMSNGDTTRYCITDGTDWEVGIGTWNTGGTLSRTTVLKSSNSDAAVSFAAGTKTVFMDLDSSMFGAWKSYTPTWTGSSSNPSIGNGTLAGSYIQIGKTVIFRFNMITGSTTTFGSGFWKFSLPIAAGSTGFSAGVGTSIAIYHTAGTNSHIGQCYPIDANNIVWDAAESRSNWSSSSPFTWTTSGDTLYGQIIYEIA